MKKKIAGVAIDATTDAACYDALKRLEAIIQRIIPMIDAIPPGMDKSRMLTTYGMVSDCANELRAYLDITKD
jgi:hypothetical protein